MKGRQAWQDMTYFGDGDVVLIRVVESSLSLKAHKINEQGKDMSYLGTGDYKREVYITRNKQSTSEIISDQFLI